MSDFLAIKSAQEFLKLVTGFFNRQRHSEFKKLRQLTTKKFNEIEQTHAAFLNILGQFKKKIETAHQNMASHESPETIAVDVIDAIEAAKQLRETSRERRRAAYEEARCLARARSKRKRS